MLGSIDGFYDDLAPYFREYAERRSAYLRRIDQLVAPWLTGTSLLDVGAGDGVRAKRLANGASLERLVMVEPSHAMAALCRKLCPRVLTVPVEELELPDQTFDNVICLWNVIGHVRGFETRVDALRRMASLLADGGSLHLDVHNRYNARAYGWKTVAGNVLRDLTHPRRENGERKFELVFEGRRLQGQGYLFNPSEIARTIEAAGLRILQREVVDYNDGASHRSPFMGQLYFRLAS